MVVIALPMTEVVEVEYGMVVIALPMTEVVLGVVEAALRVEAV
jgi:hypothetical protein